MKYIFNKSWNVIGLFFPSRNFMKWKMSCFILALWNHLTRVRFLNHCYTPLQDLQPFSQTLHDVIIRFPSSFIQWFIPMNFIMIKLFSNDFVHWLMPWHELLMFKWCSFLKYIWFYRFQIITQMFLCWNLNLIHWCHYVDCFWYRNCSLRWF